MVAYPYQDVAACTVARCRTRFCANLPASFVVYPNLLLVHLIFPSPPLSASRSFAKYLSFQHGHFQRIVPFHAFKQILYGVQQPSFWNFKLISNRAIRPSLSPLHTQNLSVTFVFKWKDTNECRAAGSVGRTTDDQIWRSWVRFLPMSEVFLFASGDFPFPY